MAEPLPVGMPLPYGFKCVVLPESDVIVGSPFGGGTLVEISNGFGEIPPDETGIPYSLVADLHYPSGQPGPHGVTGVYIYAHNHAQLHERALEKVEEWRAIHLT